MITYNRTEIEIRKQWNKKHYDNNIKEASEINKQIAENLEDLFKMFLVSLIFIIILLQYV